VARGAPRGSAIDPCRVAPGDCSPGAPKDPDVRNSRIRLVETWVCYVILSVHTIMEHTQRRNLKRRAYFAPCAIQARTVSRAPEGNESALSGMVDPHMGYDLS
jgi:hypothetical protein